MKFYHINKKNNSKIKKKKKKEEEEEDNNHDEHKYKQLSTSICDPLVSGSPFALCKFQQIV